MLLHALYVLLQILLPLLIGLSSYGIGVSRERHLRVNHHTPTLRELHHHIRAEVVASIILHVLLHEIFFVLMQSTRFEQRLQHHLAPVALGFVLAFQRLGQVHGIVADTLSLLTQRADRFALYLLKTVHQVDESLFQLRLVHLTARATRIHRLLERLKLLLHRFQQFVQLLAVGFLQGTLALSQLLGSGTLHLLAHGLELFIPLTVTLLTEFFRVRTLLLKTVAQILLHLLRMQPMTLPLGSQLAVKRLHFGLERAGTPRQFGVLPLHENQLARAGFQVAAQTLNLFGEHTVLLFPLAPQYEKDGDANGNANQYTNNK